MSSVTTASITKFSPGISIRQDFAFACLMPCKKTALIVVVYKRSHFKRHFFNVLKPLNFSGNFACYRDPLVVLLFLANKEATSLNEILYCHVCHIDCVCRILGKQRRCIFKSSRNPSNSITNTNPNPSLLRIFQTAHSGFFDREKKFRQIWPVS